MDYTAWANTPGAVQKALQAEEEAREATYTPEVRQAIQRDEAKKTWEWEANKFEVDEFG